MHKSLEFWRRQQRGGGGKREERYYREKRKEEGGNGNGLTALCVSVDPGHGDGEVCCKFYCKRSAAEWMEEGGEKGQ